MKQQKYNPRVEKARRAYLLKDKDELILDGRKLREFKKKIAEEIFKDIDEALRKCFHSDRISPRWNDSQFKKLYEEIKEKYK